MTRFVLLVLFAVTFCHAQIDGQFSNQDGFVFPEEADRPDKFPLFPNNQNNPPRTPTPRRPNNPVTPNTNDYTQCIDNCPTTSEYNPVCGSDNVVYSNPGRLNCAASCGNQAIQLARYGQCTQDIRG